MSYPQQGGYPQQPYSGGAYPVEPSGGTNPATAIIAGILALVVTACEITYLVKFFGSSIGEIGLGKLPWQYLLMLGLDAVAGLLLLLGSMFTFGRKTAGAALIAIGAILAIVGVIILPLTAPKGAIPFGDYLQAIFQFGDITAIVEAVALICSPLAFILAVIPPTTRHLRGSSGSYDSYQNAGGYQQQPYNNAPNSGGFPQQQDYPGYQPQQGQGGYPQQGGYPNQQQQGWQ